MIETLRLLLRDWTHDDAVRRIDRMPARAGDSPEAGVFAIERKADGIVAGMAVLVPLPASEGLSRSDMEIGWHLHPDSWGNGFATEAANALAARGFAAGVPDLYAVTKPANAPSQGVCRRIGMTDLGLRADWYDQELRAFRLDAPSEPVG